MKKSFSTRTTTRRRPRRLQVEQLENRLVMSGTPAAETLGLALAADPTTEQVPMLIAPPAQEVGVLSAQAAVAAASFERFTSLEEIKEYIIANAVEQYRDWFGKEALRCNGDYYEAIASPTVMTTALGSATSSDTNTQVNGVDEADLMETDGDYLYMVSHGELLIVDVRSVDQPTIAARLTLDQDISSMYLSGDRLTLISQSNSNCRCLCSGSSGFDVTVLDVADRASPSIVQRTSFEGNLLDSRAIGDKVYLVLGSYQFLPSPQSVEVDGTYRYETEQEYRDRMADYLDDYALPSFTSFDAEGNEVAHGAIADPTGIYKLGESEHWGQLTTVAVIDMASDQPGPIDAITLAGNSVSQVYVSTDNIYLISSASGGPWFSRTLLVLGDISQSSDTTLIHKVALAGDEGKLELVAEGTVAGHVLDQFSVDEYNGFLRVATTEGWAGDQNHLFVLNQNGTALDVVGSVNGLAPGEKIYSARFMGEQAFVVTFRQVDPLFAIDLSDPTAPEVKGELTIPGFSNYLQSIDGGLLIGVGRNAGDNGLYQDPQISLFDVNDLGDPLLVDRVTIPTGRTGGLDIFSDHHVVAYYPDSHILTVSVPDMDSSDSDVCCCWNWVNDLYVFQVDTSETSAGLEMLAKIEHTDSVLRSVQIDNRLISISADCIAIHDLANPQVALATLALNESQQDSPQPAPPVWVTIYSKLIVNNDSPPVEDHDVNLVTDSEVLSTNSTGDANDFLVQLAALDEYSRSAQSTASDFGLDRIIDDATDTVVSEGRRLALVIAAADDLNAQAVGHAGALSGADGANNGDVDSAEDPAMVDRLFASLDLGSVWTSVGEDWTVASV